MNELIYINMLIEKNNTNIVQMEHVSFSQHNAHVQYVPQKKAHPF